MNCKLEKFWNNLDFNDKLKVTKWTVNLKSFEISLQWLYNPYGKYMNCKLEKFWNAIPIIELKILSIMNCKLEKFWNRLCSFNNLWRNLMNCKLEKFWNS